MDQKHAMLYPDPNSMPTDQRTSAAAAIGLPIEAPPSYDVAVGEHQPQTSQQNIGWSSPQAPYGNPTAPAMSSHAAGEQIIYPPTQVITNQPTVPTATPHQQPYDSAPSTTNAAAAAGQSTIPLSAQLGPNPSKVTCPACGASKVSRMAYTPNSKTHLCAFILCLVGWCCCACVVPYCMNSCRTGNHYCPKCNTFLGAYNPRNNLL
ncbi:lipopolysaccharide-induced tumor necrosis factor-alpha factor homolog [Musca domestica]|uniref:Lipopolysaccharide-induced tumor necrosis factor-alpha factor homolog n=1 Tax=Musca domestica TaxID=7370 RepID=A0A1I8MUI5_MUSDO|nr:lipopolysaccharide-induced tumor necrosis factor-alpha factor homolog [Musca domestica]